MDVDTAVTEVAAAVGLAEGEAGIRDILSALLTAEPAAVRRGRPAGRAPVPIVAAVCGELRKRGIVDTQRPVRLTAAGPGGGRGRRPAAPRCGPAARPAAAAASSSRPSWPALAEQLQPAADGAPGARAELDQTHCTVPTKISRVLRMHEARALAGQRIVLLGDDDLISVAIARFAAWAGNPAMVRRLTVIDTDEAVLDWAGQQVAAAGGTAELVRHDLREPLPAGLLGGFDVAVTDPPYTVAGAELFLSRAVSALAPAPGRHVFFSFGARRPDETLAVQRSIAAMGLAVRSLTAGFNEYLGAGILAGTSNLYHLRSTAAAPAARPRPVRRPAVHGRQPGRRAAAVPVRAAARRCTRWARRPVAADRRAAGGGLPGLRRDDVPAAGAGAQR